MKSIEARIKRWEDFYARKINRLDVITIDYSQLEKPQPWPINSTKRIDYILKLYEKQLDTAKILDDDHIPHLSMVTGTEIFAEAMGCNVYRPEFDMPSAIAFIESIEDASKIEVPKLEDSSLAYLFDMADILAKKAGKDALFRIVDMQTPLDIAAIMWEKTNFYIELIEHPNVVKELSAKIQSLIFAFLDEWFERYGKSFIAHYPEYYMPYGITISEDEIGVVSNQTFEDLFLDELIDFSKRYGQIGIHSCADSNHQWESFKKIPNLALLNLVRTRKDHVASMQTLKNHTTFMPGIGYEEGIDLYKKVSYPKDAYVVNNCIATDIEDAKRKLDFFRNQ